MKYNNKMREFLKQVIQAAFFTLKLPLVFSFSNFRADYHLISWNIHLSHWLCPFLGMEIGQFIGINVFSINMFGVTSYQLIYQLK